MTSLFVVLFCHSFSVLQAQKLSLSQKVEINLRKDDFAIAGRLNAFDVMYRRHSNEADLLFFDSLGIIRKRVFIPYIDDKCSNLQFQCYGNTVCIYYEEKEGSKQILKAIRLITDTMFSEPIELGYYERSYFKERNEFQFAISEDQSKVLCYTYAFNAEEIALQAYVLNEKLETLIQVNQLLDKNKNRLLFDHAVFNNGKAVLLTTTDLDIRGACADLVLLSCSPGESTFQAENLPVKDKYFSELLVYADNREGNTHIAAYYSESKQAAPKGLYLCTYVPQKASEQNAQFIPISLRFSKNRMDLRDLHLKSMSLLQNGSTEIVSEKYFKSTRMISSNPALGIGSGGLMNPAMDYTRSITEYNYDEISVFHISAEGKLKWNQNVLKSQTSTDDGGIYSSYAMLESKLGRVYIFNDMERRSDKLMAAYLNSKGNLSLKQLRTSEDIEKLDIMPRSAFQVSANEILMPCITKGYLCLLKIQY